MTTGGALATSIDGTDWLKPDLNFPPFYLKDVVFSQDRFLCAAYSGVFASTDGIYWKDTVVNMDSPIGLAAQGPDWITSLYSSRGLVKVLYGGGEFVAVGSWFWNPLAYRSTDGLDWSPIDAGGCGPLNSLAYTNGVFVASAEFGSSLVIESNRSWRVDAENTTYDGSVGGLDGILFVQPFGQVSLNGLAVTVPMGGENRASYADGHYFLLSDGAVWVSDHGVHWRDVSPPISRKLTSAAIGNGHLIVVGEGVIFERLLDDGLVDSASLTITNARAYDMRRGSACWSLYARATHSG